MHPSPRRALSRTPAFPRPLLRGWPLLPLCRLLLLLLLLPGGAGPGCPGRHDPLDDPTPLPERILSEQETTLQPVKLPEIKQAPVEEVEIVPPPGGDPKARAVVLGKAPVEEAVQRRPDGRLQVGRIIVDPREATMLIPGRINQTEGIIEYMAVGPQGKLHESVLMLDVHPLHLQVACILLGLKAAPLHEQSDPALAIVRQGKEEADPAAPSSSEGSQVILEVSWLEDGKLVTRRAEELAYNREQKETMKKGPWVYTGSVLFKGVFGAEFEQSYIATWPDRSALFNTPLVTQNPYRGEELGLEANFSVLPPKGTPIRLTLRRVDSPAGQGAMGSAAPAMGSAAPVAGSAAPAMPPGQ